MRALACWLRLSVDWRLRLNSWCMLCSIVSAPCCAYNNADSSHCAAGLFCRADVPVVGVAQLQESEEVGKLKTVIASLQSRLNEGIRVRLGRGCWSGLRPFVLCLRPRVLLFVTSLTCDCVALCSGPAGAGPAAAAREGAGSKSG